MPLNKNFARRIEILDQCLRSTRRFTLQNLIDHVNDKMIHEFGVGVSKKTIQDDLSYLKNDKEAPIVTRRDGGFAIYSYSDPNFSIKNLPINEEEISNLRTVVQILKQLKDFNIVPEVEGIIDRLENTISTNIPDKTTIIQFDQPSKAQGLEHLPNLFEAIKGKNCLRITYQSFIHAVPKDMVIHPYMLKEFRNRWFVLARAGSNDSISVFALDRIQKIKNSSDTYLDNDLFDPETFFSDVIGPTRPNDAIAQEIMIKVSKGSAPYVLTKPIHASQKVVKELKDGSIILTLYLFINFELRSVLMSYGNGLEVRSPKALRNEMKELFKSTLKLYSK